MTNFQLLLSIGIPSLLIVVGFIYNNSRLGTLEANVNARFNSMESNLDARFNSLESSVDARFNSMESNVNSRFNSVDSNFQEVRARLNTIEADLRQFYREFGRHETDIANLKEQRRAS